MGILTATAMTQETTIPEAEFSHQHNIPRAKLKQWRTEGILAEGVDWTKEGNQFSITPAGSEKIASLLSLPESTGPETGPVQPVRIRITGRGTSARILRGRVMLPDGELGDRASIRILYPKATAQQFRLATEIDAMPTETEGIYTYDQKPAQRIRI
jgi:hypothetical protein